MEPRKGRILLKNKSVVWTPRRELVVAMPIVMDAYHFAGQESEPMITSGNDSEESHIETSYHFEDLAADLRIWNLTDFQKNAIVEYMNFFLSRLPNGYCYQTILEPTHIHLEYDYEIE